MFFVLCVWQGDTVAQEFQQALAAHLLAESSAHASTIQQAWNVDISMVHRR